MQAAVQTRLDALNLGKILGGGMAAEIAHGSCTDVPLARK